MQTKLTWPMKKNRCWECTSLRGATHEDVYTAVPVPTIAEEGSGNGTSNKDGTNKQWMKIQITQVMWINKLDKLDAQNELDKHYKSNKHN